MIFKVISMVVRKMQKLDFMKICVVRPTKNVPPAEKNICFQLLCFLTSFCGYVQNDRGNLPDQSFFLVFFVHIYCFRAWDLSWMLLREILCIIQCLTPQIVWMDDEKLTNHLDDRISVPMLYIVAI